MPAKVGGQNNKMRLEEGLRRRSVLSARDGDREEVVRHGN